MRVSFHEKSGVLFAKVKETTLNIIYTPERQFSTRS